MLGTLLESRAGTQRRSGGALASVVVHVAIIAAAVVGTAAGKAAPKIEKPTIIPVVAPVTKAKVVPRNESHQVSSRVPTDIVIRTVEVPTIVPVGLPDIQVTHGLSADSIVIGAPGRGGVTGPMSIIDGESRGGNSEWSVNEVLMNVITPARPRYPESLRSAGIDGRVLVQFTVDTTGRVDMNSVKILSSTHDLFSRAVRDALGNFRFRPAETAGHRVNALAEMPFEFQITK